MLHDADFAPALYEAAAFAPDTILLDLGCPASMATKSPASSAPAETRCRSSPSPATVPTGPRPLGRRRLSDAHLLKPVDFDYLCSQLGRHTPHDHTTPGAPRAGAVVVAAAGRDAARVGAQLLVLCHSCAIGIGALAPPDAARPEEPCRLRVASHHDLHGAARRAVGDGLHDPLLHRAAEPAPLSLPMGCASAVFVLGGAACAIVLFVDPGDFWSWFLDAAGKGGLPAMLDPAGAHGCSACPRPRSRHFIHAYSALRCAGAAPGGDYRAAIVSAGDDTGRRRGVGTGAAPRRGAALPRIHAAHAARGPGAARKPHRRDWGFVVLAQFCRRECTR